MLICTALQATLAFWQNEEDSVQGAAAAICSTQTGNLCLLDGKLVVIRNLLINAYRLPGIYHYLLLRLHGDDLCVAVRLQSKHIHKFKHCDYTVHFLFSLRDCSETIFQTLSMPVHTHIAAVINKSSQVSTFGGINDGVLIDSEQVAASDALLLIFLLSQVSDDLRKKDTERRNSCLSSSLS